MNTSDALGEKIRQRRKELKLTQIQLGKRIGVSGPTVSDWEAGVNRPKDILKLAGALELHLDELVDELADEVMDKETFFSLAKVVFEKIPATEQHEFIKSLMDISLRSKTAPPDSVAK